MKKIGIFGGTFNPIHNGHLRSALEVYEHFMLDKVLFVPSYIPPHKDNSNIALPEDRLAMTKLAIENFDGFEVCDMEIARRQVSYSIDTISALKESNDCEIFFILGGDAFGELSTWRGYEKLIFLCNFIVMKRPGTQIGDFGATFAPDISNRFLFDEAQNIYKSDIGTHIFVHNITQLNISATQIRWLRVENKSIKYLLPQSVEQYICKHNLYNHI